MLTSALISLPPETLQRMAESDRAASACGGGSAIERRAGLALLALALFCAPLAALLFH